MNRLTKLYCGRSKPDGTLVTLPAIEEFLRAEVATQYDDFTVTFTVGYRGVSREYSFVIGVITDPSKYPVDFRPRQIANAYKKAFDQEAVLVTQQEIESELV
jgi:uncharacterized protein DUF3574